MRCEQCGASYDDDGDSCAARFDALLALDHSRREPWGSRHGQAFAAYALDHPETHAPSLDAAWVMLHRIYGDAAPPAHVTRAMRAHAGQPPAPWRGPRRSHERARMPSITIADLDDFDAATYPDRLDDWCRSALASWGSDPRVDPCT